MKMESPTMLAPEAGPATPASPLVRSNTPDVFQQLGTLTRQLHDTLHQLGVLPMLESAADGIPDARSRLAYIAAKTAAAADKVLTSVDQAKAEQGAIAQQTRLLAQALAADPVKAVSNGSVLYFVNDVEARTRRIDGHLTDIMMAQDFHDLTGQVVAKVVNLAHELEDSLLKLLMQVIPADQIHKVEDAFLNGPVINPEGRSDVVTNQEQVDELLASLGF